jgi:tetratricopeptide (TPR) repeat protein
VSRRAGRAVAGLLVLLAGARCQARSTSSGGTAAATSRELEEARALLDRGDADGALARLQGAGDPESLSLQGRAWAKKAESAPLPTPAPPESPLPKGAPPPAAPEFKPEERKAVELLEKAVAARPDLAAAHLALAGVLGPHAIRQQEREQEALRRPAGRRPPEPAPTPEPGVDYSPERVAREYSLAVRGDPSRAPVDAMIAFAVKAGRLDDAEVGYQELVRRIKESGEPFALYGDFLAEQKKDPLAAIEQYKQALIWRPDDEATRAKLAAIFLRRGVEFFDRRQYSLAETQFAEAAKYVTDRGSEQGRILEQHQAKLREIRGTAR